MRWPWVMARCRVAERQGHTGGLKMRLWITIGTVAVVACAAFGETIRVPKDFPTIQEAINAARQLDTILVSPGRYVENIDYRAKLITITSTDPQDPETVANTIIDGDEKGSVVTFNGVESSLAVLTRWPAP